MITENDINNLEATVKCQRDLESGIKYQEGRLAFLQEKAATTCHSSFNVHHRDDKGPSQDNLTVTLEAIDIIPIIENRLKELRQLLDDIAIPRLQPMSDKM